MIKKILIANRGEIACRVIQTCKKMGIQTVTVFSEEDENSPHVFLSDESIFIGPAPSNQSYLRMDKIVEAAKETGADAVHPGYGFLSENAKFAVQLKEENIIFIGPPAKAVYIMGDKIESKQLAESIQIPTIPGYNNDLQDVMEAKKIALEIGYPVMLKAAAGGGGKGIRIVRSPDELEIGIETARSEAVSSFGDGRVFMEKFIARPRHIEIQVLYDQFGHGFSINERECSVQRRNQKIIEESPSVLVTPELRQRMGESALKLASSVDYIGVGTVEFIVDQDKNYYFLEMNTRLQVEHPVTECTTGLDLVEQQILVAQGKTLDLKKEDLKPKGWSFEVRVYSEDPRKGFLPSIGSIDHYVEPVGENIRVDSGIIGGNRVSMFYDPLLSKLITWGEDREKARLKMLEALRSYEVGGVITNIDFLIDILNRPAFVEGSLDTGILDSLYPDGFESFTLSEEDEIRVAVLVAWNHLLSFTFPLSGESTEKIAVQIREAIWEVTCHKKEDHYELFIGDHIFPLQYQGLRFERWKTVLSRGEKIKFRIEQQGESYLFYQDSIFVKVKVYTPKELLYLQHMPIESEKEGENSVNSPMPGKVLRVFVEEGESLQNGQNLAILEAMKMENLITIPRTAKIKDVFIKEGDVVETDDPLFQLD